MIRPGKNVAIKVPLFRWRETVAFYRDKVGLSVRQEQKNTVAFEFGDITLWIDRVDHQSNTDVWLELLTDDHEQAMETLNSPIRDELEPLNDVEGHWTSDPAGVVLLVRSVK